MFEVNNPFSILQLSVVSDLNIYPSRWSCLHCCFSADSLQSRSHSRGNVPSSVSINTGLIMLSRFDFHLHWDVSLSLVSDGIVDFTALQHFIFNAGAPILERMGVDQQASSSTQDLTCILQWMGEDALNGHCPHPPGERSIVCLCVRSNTS